MTEPPRSANEVLAQFDRVDANLARLDKLWAEVSRMTPEGICWGDSLERDGYDDALRAFVQIAKAIPAIDGFRVTEYPLELDSIAQNRIDAQGIGEFDAQVAVERSIEAPGRNLAEYRFRFVAKRRELVRQLVGDVFRAFEASLIPLLALGYPCEDRRPLGDLKEWGELRVHAAEIERLAGGSLPPLSSWHDLQRHLRFALPCDLLDIAAKDWPAVKNAIELALYSDRDPLPVDVNDLSALLVVKPTGRVGARLPWERLDADGFERLIFGLLCDTSGYENVQWLMKTNAPDRGRDLSAVRVREDVLAGVSRSRVIVQCKHWQSKSVDMREVVGAVAQVSLWEPPPVDVLVIATSGRFTSDAVAWVEKRAHEKGERPAVELWAESHLEQILHRRPDLLAIHGLSPA